MGILLDQTDLTTEETATLTRIIDFQLPIGYSDELFNCIKWLAADELEWKDGNFNY